MRQPQVSPKKSLDAFLAKYDPAIAKVGRQALTVMRKLLPGAIELIYDNYNALAIGFAPTQSARDAVMSIALFPRWVTLFFLNGRPLTDPTRRLKGSGNRVRHVVLQNGAATLTEPAVLDLIRQAVAQADPPLPQFGRGKRVIKSISAKQRPRRPGAVAPRKSRTRSSRGTSRGAR
jgi:hypothetical protein